MIQPRSLAKICVLAAVYAAEEPNLSRNTCHVIAGAVAIASRIYVAPVPSRVALSNPPQRLLFHAPRADTKRCTLRISRAERETVTRLLLGAVRPVLPVRVTKVHRCSNFGATPLRGRG